MPDEVTTTTETAAPAATTPETYNSNGRVDVDEAAFLTEDDPEIKKEAEPTTTTTETTTPAKAAETTTETGKTGEETTTTEAGKAAVGDPKLLAGKYNSEEELNGGLTGLGLDPTKYADTAAKEAAYTAGQAAMTRITQQATDQEKADRDAAAAAANNPAPAQNATDLAQKIIGSLDMTKINDVGELVQQLVPALIANMPTPQQQLSPEEIAAQIQPKIQEREERIKALAGLETEVPRLAMKVDEATGKPVPVDPVFRKAFAVHLMGNNYKRDAAGLKQAMTDFLGLGRSIAEAQGIQIKENAADKGSAAQPAGSGQSPANGAAKGTPEDDILGGIMGAFEDHSHKVGLS